MAKYRKKPVVIEAIQLNYRTFDEILNWIGKNAYPSIDLEEARYGIIIETLEGEMRANDSDYIIKGVNGEFYPCKPDIFHKTYEEVEE